MTTKDIVLISVFAALIAALGIFPPLTLPVIGVPITTQSIGPMLAGAFLGAKRAALALLLFCTLVVIGVPILAGGFSGLAVFYGPTGGFVLAWILAAGIMGWAYDVLKPRHIALEATILFIGGVGLVYAIGFLWFSWLVGTPFWVALMGGWIFLPGDALKIVLVIGIRRKIAKLQVLL